MILLIDATAADDLGNTASASVAVTVSDPLPAAGAEGVHLEPAEDSFGIHQSMVRWRTIL